MPKVSVKSKDLFSMIGKEFSESQFEDLCFEFGIELDEVTSEYEIKKKEVGEERANAMNLSKDTLYRIEVPANRYDLICLEGLSMALRAFLGVSPLPKYSLRPSGIKVIVKKSPEKVRPFIACAVLRNITFTEETLKGIIELQDKLHGTICKNRSLASIGTYDLDTLKGDIYYEALRPDEIKFIRLKGTEVQTGHEIMEELKKDLKLKEYCHLLENKEVYPILRDSVGTVLSMPPMINSEPTKLTVNTKNVFVDVTGLDATKTKLVLTTVITMFSMYCKEPFSIESCVYESEIDGTKWEYPTLTPTVLKTNLEYLNNLAGIQVSQQEVVKLLSRFGMEAKIINERDFEVTVPVSRTDVLHPCDVAEDLAIAYGYNNIKKVTSQTVCAGYQQPINKLTDLLRLEMAEDGYVECLTFTLISKKDHFDNMEIKGYNPNDVVTIFGAKTHEFEIFRKSLLPCILKTIESNMSEQVPFKIFEISDVVIVDHTSPTGARNRRRLCFAYTASSSTSSGFEVIHGTIDDIMTKLRVNYEENESDYGKGYHIEASNETYLFPGRQANLIVKGQLAGTFGIVHPTVLKNFNIKYPVSVAEIDIEFIFDLIISEQIKLKK